MSIASQLQAYENGLTDAYNMVSQRGGTMPVHKNMSSLASAIATIPSGGGVGPTREVDANGKYWYPTQNFSFSLPSNATDAGDNALYYAFFQCFNLTSVDFSSLTTVSGASALCRVCYNCSRITSADFSSLATISGPAALSYAFCNCSRLTSASFPVLTTVSGSDAFSNAFYSCGDITSVSFPALTTVSGSSAFSRAFCYCYDLTTVSFPALDSISGGGAFYSAFQNCSNLTSLSFPALTASSFGSNTNQFDNMLNRCSGVTVHFPSAVQSTIGNWSSVTSGFGGTNTTVLFDL